MISCGAPPLPFSMTPRRGAPSAFGPDFVLPEAPLRGVIEKGRSTTNKQIAPRSSLPRLVRCFWCHDPVPFHTGICDITLAATKRIKFMLSQASGCVFEIGADPDLPGGKMR